MTAAVRAERFAPWAFAVFALALALRFLHLWQLRDSPFLDVELGDSAAYAAWARRIAAGDWFGSEVFFQAPLYPYFLGIVFATLGEAPLVVRGLQCVLGALACALLASAGASLFSRGAGIAAGLLLATYAPAIFLDALLQKSVLDLLLLCLALWLAARLARRPSRRLAAALGLASGLLVLARENAVLIAGVLGLWLLWLPDVARSRRALLALAFGVGLAAPLLPVALRNWWIGGELHLATSQFGANLYIGNHPGAPGGYVPFRPGRGTVEFERQDITELAEEAVGRRLTPGEVSAYWRDRALDYIVSEPLDWLALMARKLALFVSTVELVDTEDQYATADYSPVLRAAGWLGHFGVLAPLAVVGGFVVWPRRRELWWLYAALAAYAASVLVFYVVTRYRHPLVPFLALFAGAGLAGVGPWLRSAPRPVVASGIGLALLLAVFSNAIVGMPKDRMRAVTHQNLAAHFRADGQPARAALHLERALALDPVLDDAASVRRELAAIHLELGAASAARGDLAAALAHYRSASGARPGAPGPLWAAAWLLATHPGEALGEPSEALALAERAAALETRLEPAMLETLAAAYAAAGRFEPALAKAREAAAALVARGEPVPPRLAAALASYARGEPLRRPHREGER